jgi:hypothetical protein
MFLVGHAYWRHHIPSITLAIRYRIDAMSLPLGSISALSHYLLMHVS